MFFGLVKSTFIYAALNSLSKNRKHSAADPYLGVTFLKNSFF